MEGYEMLSVTHHSKTTDHCFHHASHIFVYKSQISDYQCLFLFIQAACDVLPKAKQHDKACWETGDHLTQTQTVVFSLTGLKKAL